MNQIDLNDKVAIITGGAQGFGYSMVERFSKSGAKVVIWDKDEELLKSLTLPENVNYELVDITSYDSVQKSTIATLDKNNKIDILINNAGIAGPSFKTWEYPIDQWQNVIDIDLTGLFYCCKSIVPHMIKANYGRIVNIASIAGKEGNPNAMPYSAAKAGVIALTKSLGKELADKNIAVNCVTPNITIRTISNSAPVAILNLATASLEVVKTPAIPQTKPDKVKSNSLIRSTLIPEYFAVCGFVPIK